MSLQGNLLDTDPGRQLLVLMTNELLRRLHDPETAAKMGASEFEMIRKLLSDNSVTLASIRRGDFGETVARVEEQFPEFPDAPGALQ